MFTEYPKIMAFFKQAIHKPNVELRDILYKYAEIKKIPDDIGAARFLIKSYYSYQNLLATANASIK